MAPVSSAVQLTLGKQGRIKGAIEAIALDPAAHQKRSAAKVQINSAKEYDSPKSSPRPSYPKVLTHLFGKSLFSTLNYLQSGIAFSDKSDRFFHQKMQL